MVEQRRSHRALLAAPVQVKRKGSDEVADGRARDVSVGGMFVETTSQFAFGADVVVYAVLPGQKEPFALPAVVRWTRHDGIGLQFGLLGARETHLITEVVRSAAPKQPLALPLELDGDAARPRLSPVNRVDGACHAGL
jgi:hypothetical protein